ncbi:MAG: transposase [Candidatus Omnitrophota bacterium]
MYTQKIFDRKQIRLKNYDYSDNGWYFITICSRNRKNIFWQCNKSVGAGLASAQNNIKLSIIGKIIDKNLVKICDRCKNIKLDKYVIMPNHVHCIIKINKREEASPSPTISELICSFKSKCSIEYLNFIKQNNLNESGRMWQRSFYDYIIRNENSLRAIKQYIKTNPVNWERDINNLLEL